MASRFLQPSGNGTVAIWLWFYELSLAETAQPEILSIAIYGYDIKFSAIYRTIHKRNSKMNF